MKQFFRRHQKLHILLLTNVVLLAAFFLLQNQRRFMTAVSEVMAVVRHGLASLCYLTSVSVAELLVILLVGLFRMRRRRIADRAVALDDCHA